VIHTAKASGRELWVEGRGGVRMSTRDGRTGPCAMSCCWFAEAYLRKRGEAVRETCDGQGVVLWRYYWGWGNARPSSPPWPSQPGREPSLRFVVGHSRLPTGMPDRKRRTREWWTIAPRPRLISTGHRHLPSFCFC
jgi:hypothetical protein